MYVWWSLIRIETLVHYALFDGLQVIYVTCTHPNTYTGEA